MKSFRMLGFLMLAFTMFFAKPAQAQYGSAYQFPLIAGDTLNNVDTVFKGIHLTAGYKDLGIHVLVNKISGTVAGKLILLASTNGKDYFPTDSLAYAGTQTNSAVTPTSTNEAWVWKTGTPFPFYLVMATSTGTVSAQVTVLYTARRSQVQITP
jgi:hypothetical protein